MDEVDLILLSRDDGPPAPRVRAGIEAQAGVRLRIHRVIGAPRPEDPNRWATIARARNQGKRLGSSRWVFFLDDDVVLGPGCVAALVEGLKRRPLFAGLAADYLGEMAGWPGSWETPPHVGMGATLFRRERLAFLAFRWEPDKCECRCCGDDLRRIGFGIGYLPGAEARHEPRESSGAPDEAGPVHPGSTAAASAPPPGPGRVLAAFDRNHLARFRRQFLRSLRASGNAEPVTAVTYGLYPTERRLLEAEPGVEVVALPENGVAAPIRRLTDFQGVLARWPEGTPAAYWDAGDVLFQGRLAGLWDLVRAHPDKLLAAREPLGYPGNRAIDEWTQTILHPGVRRRTFELLAANPLLNSGFAAGTAGALLRYFGQAELIRGRDLRGTADWGDQTALNVYCHTRPDDWHEIPDSWNFCLFTREGAFRVRPDGRYECRSGRPVHVVHGNARTLGHVALSLS